MQPTTAVPRRVSRRALLAVLAALAMLLAVTVPGAATAGDDTQHADVLTQDESGVYAHTGARLTRTDHSFSVRWQIPTPEPGSYLYPTPDQIPPGAPEHPPIDAGYPEVFTLWAFVFSNPDQCTDGMCDFDDIGDTPAQGGIYQLDGTVARSQLLRLGGKVRLGMPPDAGVALSDPGGAEIHVAMTSHGMAREGADLARQLNGAVGGPPNWWVAIFHAP
jgi:hypothetical protein